MIQVIGYKVINDGRERCDPDLIICAGLYSMEDIQKKLTAVNLMRGLVFGPTFDEWSELHVHFYEYHIYKDGELHILEAFYLPPELRIPAYGWHYDDEGYCPGVDFPVLKKITPG